jgi:hypothetical protein
MSISPIAFQPLSPQTNKILSAVRLNIIATQTMLAISVFWTSTLYNPGYNAPQ